VLPYATKEEFLRKTKWQYSRVQTTQSPFADRCLHDPYSVAFSSSWLGWNWGGTSKNYAVTNCSRQISIEYQCVENTWRILGVL